MTGSGLADLIEAYPGDRLYITSVAIDGGAPSYQVEGPPRSAQEDASHVAVPIKLVEANAEPIVDPCPEPPSTLSVLQVTRPYERALCLANERLKLTDVWLAEDSLSRFADGAGEHLPVALKDGIAIPAPGWKTVTGRFGLEDGSCGDPVGRLWCRERFVIESVLPGASPFTEVAGTWNRMSDAPISGRSTYVALPIDRGVLIWGGDAADIGNGPTGAIYQPATDAWTPVSRAPGPPRLLPAAAWTGEQALIWGGLEIFRDGEYVANPGPLRDGLAYDPATDQWSSIPRAPISGGSALGGWTGREFVVVSSSAESAAWNPASKTWRLLPDPPIPKGYIEGVWTGAELIVLGLTEGGNDPIVGAVLDPAAGRWRPIAEVPYDGLVLGLVPNWTGSEMHFAHHAYDPATDAWRILSIEGCEGWYGLPGGVWTGNRLLSQDQSYDPTTGRCSQLPDAPIRPGFEGSGAEIRAHESHTPAWFDGRLVIWSGGTGLDVGGSAPDGAVFTPAAP